MSTKLDPLEKEFREQLQVDERNAAEFAYAIAMLAKNQGNLSKARDYAKQCIQIFEKLNIKTLEQAAAKNITIKGIPIPGLIHEKVVEDRFRDILEGDV
jgi:hypothetical protein